VGKVWPALTLKLEDGDESETFKQILTFITEEERKVQRERRGEEERVSDKNRTRNGGRNTGKREYRQGDKTMTWTDGKGPVIT